jgi:hypothetical protein
MYIDSKICQTSLHSIEVTNSTPPITQNGQILCYKIMVIYFKFNDLLNYLNFDKTKISLKFKFNTRVIQNN